MAQLVPLLLFVAPIPVAIGLIIYFFVQRSQAVNPKPTFWGYVATVAFWGLAALVIAAVLIFAASMYYHSGNGPLAIFVYGPAAFALGSILGAVMWRRDTVKPNQSLQNPDRPQAAGR